jgi:hypothetical protein
MKKALLILGVIVFGLLGVLKIWGLIYLQFSVKQTVYAVAMLASAVGMLIALRSDER